MRFRIFAALVAALIATPALAVDFRLDIARVEAGGARTVLVPISASSTAIGLQLVKANIEYDSLRLAFVSFEATSPFIEVLTFSGIPFGVCHQNVNASALFLATSPSLQLMPAGPVVNARFLILGDTWAETPVRVDCYCGPGVAHVDLVSESPLEEVLNACDPRLTITDGAVTRLVPPVAVTPATWGAVRALYK